MVVAQVLQLALVLENAFMTSKTVLHALGDLEFALDHAYRNGLHEFGYDPVAVVLEALRPADNATDTSIAAGVAAQSGEVCGHPPAGKTTPDKSTTCLGIIRDGICSCGQHRPADETVDGPRYYQCRICGAYYPKDEPHDHK